MNIFSFKAHFDSEEVRRIHFKQERDKIGVKFKCQGYGNDQHYWIKSVWSYKCESCRGHASLCSSIIMQNSNLSFMTWYKTIFLMTTTKKRFSFKEIQKQLGMKRHESVWVMVHYG